MTSEHQTKAIVVVVGEHQNNCSNTKQQKLLFDVLPGQLLLSAIVLRTDDEKV